MSAAISSQSPLNRLNYINAAAYILNVLVTYGIGSAGYLNRPTNAELSDKYQTIITPTGFAFAIWGIIFVLQLIWVVAQIALKQYRNSDFITKVGHNYAYVCLAQVAWTIAFSYEFIEVSVGMMLSILFPLYLIVTALTNTTIINDPKNYALWKLPFSIHFGWILAASAVNVSVLLVDYGVSPSIQFYVGVASLILVTLIGVSYSLKQELIVPLVLIWAWNGIYLELKKPKDSITGQFTSDQITWTQYGTLAGIVVSGLSVLYSLYKVYRIRSAGVPGTAEETAYIRAQD
jgi:translocator protein